MSRLILPDGVASKKWVNEYIDNYWMGLGDTSKLEIVNPFSLRTKKDIETPHLFVLDLMRKPENFWFTCKHVFNKNLHPFQLAILRELWIRPFPMLIGSRGCGKSFLLALYAMIRATFCQGSKIVIVGAAFRQAKAVFDYCQEIWENAPLLQDLAGNDKRKNGPRRDIDRVSLRIGESIILGFPLGDGTKIRGQRANITISDEFACLERNTLVETDMGLVRIGDSFRDANTFKLFTGDESIHTESPARFIETPPTKAFKVTTRGGYSFTCSAQHKVFTTRGWKVGKDLTQEDYLVFENKYRFPTEYICHGGFMLEEELGWLFGLLISEGSIADKYNMRVQMTDEECVGRCSKVLARLMPDRTIGRCERAAYTDGRGWKCKASTAAYCCNLKVRDKLEYLGLARCTSHNKVVPWSILQSPRSVVIAFLKGLFEGDGSAFVWGDRGEKRLGVAYYTVSEQLASEVQVLLQKLGIFCTRQHRKSNISDKPQWMLRLNGAHAHRLADILSIDKWKTVLSVVSLPQSRGDHVVWDKSRNKWKAELLVDGKRKYLGRFHAREEAERAVHDNRPVPSLRVRSVEELPEDAVLYDYYLPRTHSFYGNCFRQHNSIPVDIFETVVRGFAAVSLDPIVKVQRQARIEAMRKLGLWKPEDDVEAASMGLMGNQTICSGTAYYAFNHFCDYWKRYKGIVESRGDISKLEELFKGTIPDHFNWKDYSVIRIPYRSVPKGFMDEKQIAQAKATVHVGTYLMEYGACWAMDSNGFFKRSLIEACVAGKPGHPIELPSCGLVKFSSALRGHPGRRYVMAVDPASERDNFSIVILELWPDHRRIVFCWTTTRARYKAQLKRKLTQEKDFYRYCARKIRDLKRLFNIERIALDSQGGGIAVYEALQDPTHLKEGEIPILPVVDPEDEKDTDGMSGEHILEMINFGKPDWVSESNHGMRKDFEDKVLLFPEFDSAVVGLALEEDKASGRVKVDSKDQTVEKLYDTLEDCVLEIEDLKDELATIVHSQTGTAMRDRWDTPETKVAGGKKGRLRKDRYSSLLMANMVARILQRTPTEQEYSAMGGFANVLASKDKDKKTKGKEKMWIGPDWWTGGTNQIPQYGTVVRRGVE